MATQKTPRPGTSKPVMVRVSLEMWDELDAIARREESHIATVVRRLARERLDQLRRGGRE